MRRLNVAFIGAGFMAKAHALACRSFAAVFPDAPAHPHLHTICARASDEEVAGAARRFGFEKWTTDVAEVVTNREIDVVFVLTPNDSHRDLAVLAAEHGKHVLCEKPMAMHAAEAAEMVRAVESAGVRGMLCFTYRRTPAVIYARKLLDEGTFGRPYAFRGFYLQDWSADSEVPFVWRFDRAVAGTGTLGDIGSHVLDFAHYLVGSVRSVNAVLATWIDARPGSDGAVKHSVEVDDELLCTMRFENGAVGSIQASRNALGRKNYLGFELNCENGSLFFDYERMNELRVCRRGDRDEDFQTIHIGPDHPYGTHFWPIPALGIGYTELKLIEVYDFLDGVIAGHDPEPSFRAGLENQRVLDAMAESAAKRTWVDVTQGS